MGIFTDSHYSSKDVTCNVRYNSRSLCKIKEAFEYFSEQKCDHVICLGDLIDKEDSHEKEIENLKSVSRVFSEYDMRISVVMGNHDAFAFDVDEFFSVLGEKYIPVDLFTENTALIFIDACHFKTGEHYKRGDSDWTDTYYPHTDDLRARLARVQGDAYVFLHQVIDPEIRADHRLYNDAEIRAVLEESKKVRAVFEGHYHEGHDSRLNGIRYTTFPAMCEKDDAYYVTEI
ncbi:MAG: metallophosphoesterase [Clostridia bacterium]|nr:metallophosphoesterase [Clostridia bacterium]